MIPQLPLENDFSVGNGKIVQSARVSRVNGETGTVLFFIEVYKKKREKTRAPQFVGRHLGVGCRTGRRLQILPFGKMLVVRDQLRPQSSLKPARSREPAGARLTFFLRVVDVFPSCLHGQEVEQDPQGAGKAPKMWLAPLAADPVHLLGNHGALRDTEDASAFGGRRRRVGGEVRRLREAQRSARSPGTNEVPFQGTALLGPPPPESTASVLMPASASASVERGADLGGAFWQ